jgi:hypothetical protein
MASQEGFSRKIASFFYGTNHPFRTIRMLPYLISLSFYIWQSIMTRYTTPKTPSTHVVEKKPSEHNAQAMNSILCSLSESKFVRVMHCGSVK